jgi:hypothetical protein
MLKEKKEQLLDFFDAVKGHHLSLAIGVLLYGGYLLVRADKARTNLVIQKITTPYKRMMGWLCDFLPVSVMELCCLAAALLAVVVLVRGILLTIRRPQKCTRIYKTIAFFLAAALLVWDGYCWLWGLNYYGDSFSDQSGLEARALTAQELYRTTAYYAEQANELSGSVSRDANGVFDEPLEDIFARSDEVYAGLVEEYPFLDSPCRTPKRMLSSEWMSRINFTGFFFPFTAETNLNDASPAALIPSTIAHELAHQKNIATEQEANFVAVRACMTSDLPAYAYSGALLAYIHLGNALYKTDRSLWEEVYGTLNEEVRADLDYNNAYWADYQTKSADAAETVYTAFLSSYDQPLGMQSYEACVGLLAADYLQTEEEKQSALVSNADGIS